MKALIAIFIGLSSISSVSATEIHHSPDSAMTLGELNVVAAKQEEQLRGEAISATLLNQDDLEQMNAVSMKGISDAVPNFYIPDYGSRITSTIYVRGIGARMDQPAVGLNVDNVPYLNKNAYDFDLTDISSAEILRGPQSTLFGRNTMGGLINITTISPLHRQGWRIMAQGATGSDWKGSAGWYHKFNSSTAFAAIASVSALRGFFKNNYDGHFLDHELSGALRTKFDWNISESVAIRNAFSSSLLNQGGYPYEYIERGLISYNDPCFYKRFCLNDGLTLRWKHDKFTMTSVTTVQYLDDNMTLDQDFLPESFFTLTQKQRETGLTEDVVFRGNINAGPGNYQWLGGAFMFYKHLDMKAPVTFKERGIADLIVKHRNESNPEYPIEWDSPSFLLNSDFLIPTYGFAIYHQSKYDIENWHFSAAIRADAEFASLDYHSYCDTGYEIFHKESDGSLVPSSRNDIAINERGDIRRAFLNWMPKFTVLFDFMADRQSNVYLNISKGWKAGGFNTQMFSEVLQQRLMSMMGIGKLYDVDQIVGYKPEFSWNYEIGTHLALFEGALNIDVSAFYIDCSDQQLTMFPDGTTTGRIMANAGKTRSIGAEISLNWIPVAGLNINASYGLTDAKFVKFNDGIHDYAGKYIPYAPRNTLFLQAIWQYSTGRSFIKHIVTDINMRGTGKIFWNEDNTLIQPFYALLGAGITFEGARWSLQLWGKNLTGTRYHTFYFMSMGNEFLQRGRPIQAGLTLRFNF